MHWQKITLVGLGLLGGSLGLAIRERRLARRVEGFVRRAASVTECEQLGIVDRATLDLSAAVQDADLVVLCTPIARMSGLARQMQPALRRGAVLTDVGSAKASVVRDLEPLAAQAGAQFVGSHPMAGAERMGPGAARADLFQNTVCVVTPTAHSAAAAVSGVERFWRGVGARTLRLAPEAHDDLVSRSSHLPHLVAAVMANLVLDPLRPREQALLCANGFRDTTRIASGSPEMWRDIALANGENIAGAIRLFIEALQKLQQAIDRQDGEAIDSFLSEAKQRRDQWGTLNSSASPE